MSLIYSAKDNRGSLAPLNGARDGAAGWDDAQVSTGSAIGAASLATVTFRDTGMPLTAMSANTDDTLGVMTQLPHRWNKGQVRPHFHWIPLAAPAAPRIVRFIGAYAWSLPGVAVPSLSGWTTFTIDVPVIAGDEFKQKITAIASIDPTAQFQVESVILMIKLTRNGTSAVDDYSDGGPNNVGILSIDTHFQSEKLGTVTDIPTMW